jgi:hypothetical protein
MGLELIVIVATVSFGHFYRGLFPNQTAPLVSLTQQLKGRLWMCRVALKPDYFRDHAHLFARVFAQNQEIHATANRGQFALEMNQSSFGPDIFGFAFGNHVHTVVGVPLGAYGKGMNVARTISIFSYLLDHF